MDVDQQELDAVDAKLHQQNAFKAAIALAIWAVPLLVFWYWLYQFDDRFAPLMLVVSGACMGLVVRYYGRGYTPVFSIIAFLAHSLVVGSALIFGLSLGAGQSVRAFILVGLYAIGAWLAVYLGRIAVPFLQHRAFYELTEQSQHSSSKLARNRWFLMVPLTFFLCSLTLCCTLFGLTGFTMLRATESQVVQAEQRRQAFEDKAIDVTSANLSTLSTDDAMRYAYAFYKGVLPNKKGQLLSKYPLSAYKARRILSFLTEECGYARAKFVLGLLTLDDNGSLLIQQAADEGDIFAKIRVAAEFGCYGDTERARNLLTLLAKTTDKESAQGEIYSVLNTPFTDICAEFQTPDFALMYIRD